MNSNSYRIVFNRARGQFMAVSETASSQNKGKGEHHSPTNSAQTGNERWPGTACSVMAMSIWLSMGALPAAHAQIIADPTASASQRPTVLLDSTGRPLVNIQTPSAAGVSRNTYSRFDVQSNGVVLNNARASNPWLATGEAKVILNEVNSSNPSYLGGAITVNGNRAQVVIANPSGIKVDGASFVNASRATLTTGTSAINNGALTGVLVNQGTVEIMSKGLSVKGTSYTDILSRAVIVNGRIDANANEEINITTGAMSVDYATGQLTTTTGTGAAPTWGIDTSALGGMYAGKITLMSTEAGVGVRNAGTLQGEVNSGQLIITADGMLQNTGRMDAAVTSAATVQGRIDNSGTALGRNLLMLNAGASLNISGNGLEQSAATPSTVLLRANVDVNVSSNANVSSNGTASVDGATTQGQVIISAGRRVNLQANSKISATGNVHLTSDDYLWATNASIISTAGDVTALTAQGFYSNNSIVTGKKIHLETGAEFKSLAGSISIMGGQVRGTEQTSLIAAGGISIGSPGASALSSGGDLYMNARYTLTVDSGTTIQAGNHLTAVSGDSLSLRAISGTDANNSSQSNIIAAGDVSLSGGTLYLQGNVTAGGAMNIEAHKSDAWLSVMHNSDTVFRNRVKLSAGQDLTVSVYNGNLWASAIEASGHNISLISSQSTNITNAVNLVGAVGMAVASTVTARGDLTVGSIGSDKSKILRVRGSSLSAIGRAKLITAGSVDIASAPESIAQYGDTVYGTSVRPATITAADVTIQGKQVMGRSADINATAGHLSMIATGGVVQFTMLNGRSNAFTATGNVQFHAFSQLSLNQTIASAGGNMGLTSAGSVNNSGSTLRAKGVLSLSSADWQSNQFGLYEGSALSIYNQLGTQTMYQMALQTSGGAASEATNGQLSIESGGGMTISTNTKIAASSDLYIATGTGNITANAEGTPSGLALSYEQITGGKRDLTIIARNGDVNFNSQNITTPTIARDLTVIGNNVKISDGSRVLANRNIKMLAATGNFELAGKRVLHEMGTGSWSITPQNASLTTTSTEGSIDIQAAGDVSIIHGYIKSPGNINITSGRNVFLGGLLHEDVEVYWIPFYQRRDFDGSQIEGNKGLTISALGGNLLMSGGHAFSIGGPIKFQALGDITLEATQNHYVTEGTRTQIERSWYGGKKVITTTTHNESLKAEAVWLIGRDIELTAGSNINTYATQFRASNNLRIEAGGQANYYGVYDQIYKNTTTDKTKSLWGINYSNSKSTFSRLELIGKPAVLVSTGSIQSYSGGDQLLQGTVAEYGGTAVFQAGVGESAKANATIKLESLKNTITESRTRESNYVLWQKLSGSGSTVETMVLPKFTGPSKPVFVGPVLAQIPTGDFKTQIQILSQQPGMGYLADLSVRNDVNWQPVKLAYDQWSYKQDGLTQAGALLLAVAVAWATGGMGVDMLGTTTTVGGTTTTTLGGATLAVNGTTTLLGAAVNAGVTSLASQAAVTLVNNKGDIGQTLKDLARSDTVKATVSAMLTAGALAKIGAIPEIKALNGVDAAFTDKLTFNLINSTGRALTNAAINGGNLEDALKGALIGGVVDTLHGAVASEIKGLESDYLAHKLAHALAGCVAGAAAQGSCQDGAIGAAVGEVVADMFKSQKPGAYAPQAEWDAYDAKVLALSKIAAGAVSAYTGGNAQTAIATAETAVRYNFLTFDQNQLRKQSSVACKTGDPQACADEKRLNEIDINQDAKVRQVCNSAPASQDCQDWRSMASLARKSYDGKLSGRSSALDEMAFTKYSDVQELKSIQNLIATTPYAYGKDMAVPPHIKTLFGILLDLTPIVGDAKAFYEAKDPFDYTLAMIGVFGPVGDSAAAAIKAAKAAHQAGNAVETAAQLKKAEQLARNAVNGRVFEGSGLQAMGLDKNKDRLTAIGRNGESITIVPDATLGGIKGTFVEFKNVINITDTSQFRGYAASGQPVILVVSPRTVSISATVWDAVNASGGGQGKVVRFDPATGAQTLLAKRPGA